MWKSGIYGEVEFVTNDFKRVVLDCISDGILIMSYIYWIATSRFLMHFIQKEKKR